MEITEKEITNTKSSKDFGKGKVTYFDITKLEEHGVEIDKYPFSIRVLLENALRNYDGKLIREEDINHLINWPAKSGEQEVPYMPSRVVLQDFTGVPLIVDIADLREAVAENGGDPEKVNPLIPTDLVVDHSVQVDYYGTDDALEKNIAKEYERNIERYKVLKWAQSSFDNMQIVPPGNGIVHQVNLEYLARVVDEREMNGELQVFPDTCVGTDSHTPMVNGVAVVGFGVGGIEAEAVMLGQPYYMPLPEVVGVKLTGKLQEGVTATDLVLTVTRLLRDEGVVGKFVEFFGPGLGSLSVPDRATISNMSPEHGSTVVFFPVDEKTCDYLRLTGRKEENIEMIEAYARAQKMFRRDDIPDPEYSVLLELDLGDVVPTVAGPLNPDEKVEVSNLKNELSKFIKQHEETRQPLVMLNKDPSGVVDEVEDGKSSEITFRDGTKGVLKDGDIVIAAITSCTNTSNPSVMVGAGLIAKKAVEKGLEVPGYVKTSFAPGSKVVTDYLEKLELTPYLEALKFHTVGYGCTTCIGNSGPLDAEIDESIRKHDLYVTSVLSGNRNFGGRVHNLTRGNFLCSPMLVVVYALAGTTLINLHEDPIGTTPNGEKVYMKDLWPTTEEIQNAIQEAVTPDLFEEEYQKIMKGDKNWNEIKVEGSVLYPWEEDSTYIRRPPYFANYSPGKIMAEDVENARVLIKVGDKLSTDHISPAGAIAKDSPAGQYLQGLGVEPKDFNTYGSRRGNHEVMQRGTYANVRLRNQLAKDGDKIREGWWTRKFPEDEIKPVWDTAVEYMEEDTPVIVLGGAQYGQGSSRDWGAKGPLLQGVRAKIVEDYERIHRANLVGMGILPLTFKDGENADTLDLDGSEIYTISGIDEKLQPHQTIKVKAAKNGKTKEFEATVQLNSKIEIDYFMAGGILPYVATKFLEQ